MVGLDHFDFLGESVEAGLERSGVSGTWLSEISMGSYEWWLCELMVRVWGDGKGGGELIVRRWGKSVY